MSIRNPLYLWIERLQEANIPFSVERPARENAVLLYVATPGARWEIEFFEDGTVNVEKFVSTGTVEADPSLETIIKDMSSIN